MEPGQLVIDKKIEEKIYKKINTLSKVLLQLVKDTKLHFAPIFFDILSDYNQQIKSGDKSFTTIYLSNQMLNLWNDFEFYEYSQAYKEPKYSVIAARTFFERVVKLKYILSQPKARGEIICKAEFQKTISNYHKMFPTDLQDIRSTIENEFQRIYGIKLEGYKPKKGDSFPPIKNILVDLFPKDFEDLYYFYSEYSEFIHGNVLVTFLQTKNHISTSLVILANFIDIISNIGKTSLSVGLSEKLNTELAWYKAEVMKIHEPDFETIIYKSEEK